MSASIDVALVQADLRWQDAAANRDHLNELMNRSPGADLYVLPETFSTGFLGDLDNPAETMAGETVAWMQTQARERGAAVAGSLALSDGPARFNRFLFVTGEGVLAQYDKRHLFSFGGEDQRYQAGHCHSVVEWQGWRIDLQICYDLRFPVWCRNNRGFDLQLFVANWPSPRVEAWRSLLKARAIENQSHVIGVNRSGQDGKGIDYPGCSSAWGPLGEGLVEMNGDEGVGRVSLDRDSLADVRQRLPFLADADAFELLASKPG
jgi:omega-amidase